MSIITTEKNVKKPVKKFFRSALFFLFLAFPVLSCKYDATPPDESDIFDDKPQILFKLTGFPAFCKIAIRYWDALGPMTFGLEANKHLDVSGNFLGTVSLSHDTQTAAFILLVDINKNEKWDGNDLGFFQEQIIVPVYDKNDASRIIRFALQLSDFNPLQKISPATSLNGLARGNYLCIFSPENLANWDKDSSGNFYYINDEKKILPISAWASVAYFSVDSNGLLITDSIVSAYMPSLTGTIKYQGRCILDDNNNGIYDNIEAILSVSPFELQPGIDNVFILQ